MYIKEGGREGGREERGRKGGREGGREEGGRDGQTEKGEGEKYLESVCVVQWT